MRAGRGRTVLSVGSVLLAGAVVVVGVPAVTGAGWRDIGVPLTGLSLPVCAALAALWLLGLGVYAMVLSASLPGLSRFQAFTLNAIGSAVSNLLPLGGAAGVAVTFTLTGRWGLRPGAVAVSSLVTGVCNVAASLAAPVLALVLIVVTDRHVPGPGIGVAAVAAVLLVCWGLLMSALYWGAARGHLDGVAGRLARLLPVKVRPAPRRLARSLTELRTTATNLVRAAWVTLTVGMLAYLGLQTALFAACLAAVGADVDPIAAFLAFAVGRVLTLVVITPGGAGISEAGTAAVLVSLGPVPGPAGAGVLLFATFVFLLEIPLGALLWVLEQHRTGRRTPRPAGP